MARVVAMARASCQVVRAWHYRSYLWQAKSDLGQPLLNEMFAKGREHQI